MITINLFIGDSNTNKNNILKENAQQNWFEKHKNISKYYEGKLKDLTLHKIIYFDVYRTILPNILNSDFSRNVILPENLNELLFNFKNAIKIRDRFYSLTTNSVLLKNDIEFGYKYFILNKNNFQCKFEDASNGIISSMLIELITYNIGKEYHFNKILKNENKRRGYGNGFENININGLNKKLHIFIEEIDISLSIEEQIKLFNFLVNSENYKSCDNVDLNISLTDNVILQHINHDKSKINIIKL